MITVNEAQIITAGTISEERGIQLCESMDAIIRYFASNGKSMAQCEPSNFTDAERAYLRKKLTEQGFQVSEIGLTIYW